MKKKGLVVEGGGMKCAYSAGVLDKFLDENIDFDYCLGVSAGSANVASYMANQRERNLRYYTKHLKDKEYLGLYSMLKTGQLFGLQYIYQTLSNSDGKDPLDYKAIMKNPAEYEVVATDAQSGKPVYFDKQYLKQDDYKIIMASCALPVICRPICIDDKYYFDGGVSNSIPFDRAFEKGCDKVVAILSKPRNFVKPPEKHKKIYTRKLKNYPAVIRAIDNRHNMYNAETRKLRELEKQGKAFVFAPSGDIKMATCCKDPEIEKQLYQSGIEDFIKRKDELKEFLSK